MPQLNKEKLDQWVEAVMNEFVQKVSMFNYAEFERITRTALTPFCMEMTDEEIDKVAENVMITTSVSGMYEVLDDESTKLSRFYFTEGAKFIRDGK